MSLDGDAFSFFLPATGTGGTTLGCITTVSMKLADWMYEQGFTPTRVRKLLAVNRSTVWRWLDGSRMPSRAKIAEIEAVTGGLVTAADWADPSPPGCVRWVVGPDGVPQQVLPWSAGYDTASPTRPTRALTITWRPDLTTGLDGLSTPVAYAFTVLGGRASLLKSGVVTLDGRASGIKQVVQAANKVLIERGEEPIPYPGVWPVE
jgi:hypothetical protein